MQAPLLITRSKNYIMIACGIRKELKVIPPYKIVVVHTYTLNFLTHSPPSISGQPPNACPTKKNDERYCGTAILVERYSGSYSS